MITDVSITQEEKLYISYSSPVLLEELINVFLCFRLPNFFLQTLKTVFGLRLPPGYVPVDSPDFQVPACRLCILHTF